MNDKLETTNRHGVLVKQRTCFWELFKPWRIQRWLFTWRTYSRRSTPFLSLTKSAALRGVAFYPYPSVEITHSESRRTKDTTGWDGSGRAGTICRTHLPKRKPGFSSAGGCQAANGGDCSQIFCLSRESRNLKCLITSIDFEMLANNSKTFWMLSGPKKTWMQKSQGWGHKLATSTFNMSLNFCWQSCFTFFIFKNCYHVALYCEEKEIYF